MYSGIDFFDRTGIGKLAFIITFSVSIIGHFILFCLIFFFPAMPYYREPQPSVINIDLINLPEITPEKEPDLNTPVEEAAPIDNELNANQVPEPEVENEPDIPIEPAPLIEPIKPIEQPTFKEIVENKEPIEKKEAEPEPPKLIVKRSLKHKTLRKDVKVVEKTEKEQKKTLKDTFEKLKRKVRVANSGRYLRDGAIDQDSLNLIRIYQAEIAAVIERNWALSEQMLRGQVNLKSIIIITVQRNGSISDIWFERKSGNKYFDDCVLKAVKKSDPLPRLPEGYIRPSYSIGMIFTPSGLQRGFTN